jgi:hypothetical protein
MRLLLLQTPILLGFIDSRNNPLLDLIWLDFGFGNGTIIFYFSLPTTTVLFPYLRNPEKQD